MNSIARVFVYSLKVSVSCESFFCHLIVVKLLHMGTTRNHHYFTDVYLQKNVGRESGLALSHFASLQWHGHI
jgi:predicted ABC-type exoprotein transport system permease subunit